LPFIGWSAWGHLKAEITPDATGEVTFNGSFFNNAAGFVIEGALPYRGTTLVLEVTGTARCQFDQLQLFKMQVNNVPLHAIGTSPNHNDPDYLTARDGEFRFVLPEPPLRKMELVFWNATLRDLVIRCRIER
jgi:hypothetical protein